MALLNCPLGGWIFGVQRAKNKTPHHPLPPPPPPVTPNLKVREVS